MPKLGGEFAPPQSLDRMRAQRDAAQETWNRNLDGAGENLRAILFCFSLSSVTT